MRYKPAHAAPTGKARTLPVPVTLAAVMTAAATSGAYLQTRDASASGAPSSAAARGRVADLIEARAEAASVTTSRTIERAALLKPLASRSAHATVNPDATPAIPASLTQIAPTDRRATVKLRRELALARTALERSGAAYLSARTTAAAHARTLNAIDRSLLQDAAIAMPGQVQARPSLADAEATLRRARNAELDAADVHRSNIAHATRLAAQVRRAAAADLAATRARQDAAIARGDMVRLADGSSMPAPAVGTPIRGNGWTLTPQVRTWIAQSLTTLYANGYPQHHDDFLNLATIIYNESGGDPGSKNDWDSNAAAGIPSFGLMQTIGPTFEAYALPGHTTPSDPHAQIMAGARYAADVYKGLANVPGVKSLAAGGPYLPY